MKTIIETGRREFLGRLGAGALLLSLAEQGQSATGKPMHGLFPIGQTPCTPDNKIDFDALAAEVKFVNRGGVHGFVWPQIASGWAGLTQRERMQGAEAILAAGKGGKTALVIGVQSTDGGIDRRRGIREARREERRRRHRLAASRRQSSDDNTMVEYYKAIGKATDLPLFVQSQGDMSVDLIVRMFKEIPTMRVVKDEAGIPLERVGRDPRTHQRQAERLLRQRRSHHDRRNGARLHGALPHYRHVRYLRAGLRSLARG